MRRTMRRANVHFGIVGRAMNTSIGARRSSGGGSDRRSRYCCRTGATGQPARRTSKRGERDARARRIRAMIWPMRLQPAMMTRDARRRSRRIRAPARALGHPAADGEHRQRRRAMDKMRRQSATSAPHRQLTLVPGRRRRRPPPPASTVNARFPFEFGFTPPIATRPPISPTAGPRRWPGSAAAARAPG